MTLSEIKKMLEPVGVPTVYHHFEEGTGQEPPFICYLFSGDNDVKADDTNYVGINRLAVELYTDYPDIALTLAVGNALNNSGLVYTREDDYLEDEKMYVTIFYTEVIFDGE